MKTSSPFRLWMYSFVPVTLVIFPLALYDVPGGCGTLLSLNTGCNAVEILEWLTSPAYAARNGFIIGTIIITFINLIIYGLMSAPIIFILRKKPIKWIYRFLLLWTIFYLSCYLFLFPASDCP